MGTNEASQSMQQGTGKWWALVVCAAAVFAAAAVGGLFMRFSDRAWFDALRRPSWQPPDWLFGPVWTVLYTLMAFSAWAVFLRGRGPARSIALGVFGLQLALNAAWTGLFFYLELPGAAFAEIVALWCAIAATIALFARVSALAAWLLAPYWAWVTFAAALNFAIWRLNA